MLNKLGRKRMTITVGKRKPTLSEELDCMVTISVEKTDNPIYTEVHMPKPRPERGQTPETLVYDVSSFVEAFQEKAVAGLMENIIKGGTDPQEGPVTPLDLEQARQRNADWSDLD